MGWEGGIQNKINKPNTYAKLLFLICIKKNFGTAAARACWRMYILTYIYFCMLTYSEKKPTVQTILFRYFYVIIDLRNMFLYLIHYLLLFHRWCDILCKCLKNSLIDFSVHIKSQREGERYSPANLLCGQFFLLLLTFWLAHLQYIKCMCNYVCVCGGARKRMRNGQLFWLCN